MKLAVWAFIAFFVLCSVLGLVYLLGVFTCLYIIGILVLIALFTAIWELKTRRL